MRALARTEGRQKRTTSAFLSFRLVSISFASLARRLALLCKLPWPLTTTFTIFWMDQCACFDPEVCRRERGTTSECALFYAYISLIICNQLVSLSQNDALAHTLGTMFMRRRPSTLLSSVSLRTESGAEKYRRPLVASIQRICGPSRTVASYSLARLARTTLDQTVARQAYTPVKVACLHGS